jgi:hypothetical protein
MNKWFYAKDGQAIGPLSTPEMHQLIGEGACTRLTLVWTRGMRDWLPACMAAWMWEQRPEAAVVTAEADHPEADQPEAGGDRFDAGGELDENAMRTAVDAPAVPPSPVPTAESHRAAGGDPNRGRDNDADAGVVSMVRKLFGLG